MTPSGALAGDHDGDHLQTSTPIKHVVVIFQENVSFDHYFGTYPHAAPNKDGSVYFFGPKPNTARVNNLETSGLLTNNPNGVNPFRIDRSVPNTCDQDHNYGDEQLFAHGGLMDQFLLKSCNDAALGKTSTMGYYDGNTVTAIWNYAQHFAMSDNFFGTTFGPSTPGALNVVAGNTYLGIVQNGLSGKGFIANAASSGAVIGDADPAGDVCSNPKRTQINMSGKNVGDLMNEAGITWGSFMGGFANCAATHTGITGLTTTDYIPHHAWFQYWTSTLNASHVGPSSDAMIGKSDQANHEYDLSKFFVALQNHNLPAVSYVKAIAIEDGHAGYSNPIDEQFFLANTINAIQQAGYWKDTAIIITYDDSDGWYDHQMGPIVNQSSVTDDQLLGPGNCGTPKPIDAQGDIQNGKCGFGPRLPLLVVSPYARANYVDHRVTDFSSVVRFIEDNWNLGRIGNGSTDATAGKLDGLFNFDDSDGRALILDPSTGQIVQQHDQH
ncbi:MAG: alkaline phosphatase family protein [Acidobacteriia bacterium]|nr:alkaline phosphatase family protein [Terriglobia bacterium]